MTVFWVHARSRPKIERGYRAIADKFELPGRNDPSVNVLKLVRDWLSDDARGRWTMVLDGVDYSTRPPENPRQDRSDPVGTVFKLEQFLPESRKGFILITSRSKEAISGLIEDDMNIKEVSSMEKSQAMRLLQNKFNVSSNDNSASDLIEALDHVPLAIIQAAAYIDRNRMSISEYVDEFRKNDQQKIRLLDNGVDYIREDESVSSSVVKTLQQSIQIIYKTRHTAADVLSVMSFCAPLGIPLRLLRRFSLQSAKKLRSNSEDEELNADLKLLQAHSLITKTKDTDTYDMLPLVQVCTRALLASSGELERWRWKYFDLLSKEVPDTSADKPYCQRLLPHIESLFGREPADEDLLEKWGLILNKVARYMVWENKYETAETLARMSAMSFEKVKGKLDEDTLSSLSILAFVLLRRGKYAAAEEVIRQEYQGNLQLHGDEHLHTLGAQHNLARVLAYLGQWGTAEELYRQTLTFYRKVAGENHEDTVYCSLDLVSVLRLRGKYKKAEKLGRRMLKVTETVFGSGQPNTILSLCYLASVLRQQGRYDEAEKISWKALKEGESALGSEHTCTLRAAEEVSITMREQGKLESAENISRRNLERKERVLGKEHPHTIDCLSNLALILREQGRYRAAEEMMRSAMEKHEATLGKEHPDTLESVQRLASVLQYRQKTEEAEQLSWRALNGMEQVMGKEHPSTLNSLALLSSVLREQQRYDLAEKLSQQALKGKRNELGTEHPSTLESEYCLADLLQERGNYSEAVPFAEKALAGYQKVLGPAHSRTKACSKLLARLRQQLDSPITGSTNTLPRVYR
jgi:tetratricopeptide (TPR) repeat protein